MFKTKKYVIASAIWGNIIGYILFKVLGRYSQTQHEFNNSIITKIDDALIILLTFSVLGLPGAYFYIQEAVDNNDICYTKFIESVFFAGCTAFMLGLVGVVIGRISS